MKLIVIFIFFVVSAFSSVNYYSLQLGAFSTKKNAKKYVESLKHKDDSLKPFILPVFGLYKVYIGKFNSYQEAKLKEKYLYKNLNIDSFVNKIESDEDDKSKNLKNHISKQRVGVQIVAVRNKDKLKNIQNMIDHKYEYDIIKKDNLYKIIIKCKNKKVCKDKLFTIRKEIDKNSFIAKYSDDDLFSSNSGAVKEKIVNSTTENNKDEVSCQLLSADDDNAYIKASDILNSNSATKNRLNTTTKKDNKSLLDGLEVEFHPIIANSRYLLYENKISSSKIDVNGKKYSNISNTNSLGFGIDFYDDFFLTGKIGTRNSSKYSIDLNGKILNVKVKYPIVASGNLGYKYNLSEYELYKLYLYSALGTSMTKKDVELIDFNNVKYTDSSIYFDYSLSSGLMMKFYNNLFFKIGASRDFASTENGVEFSLSYEF